MKMPAKTVVALFVTLTTTLVVAPGMAQASGWNDISQTLNGTSWTVENYIRTVTTSNADINLDLENKPGCCLDIRLRSVSSGTIFAEEYNMQTYDIHNIATNVYSGTQFRVEGRNSVSSSDRYWEGRLWY